MSERLNAIKREAAKYRKDIKNDNELFIEQQNFEIIKQKNILKKAGVNAFFEEIINDG